MSETLRRLVSMSDTLEQLEALASILTNEILVKPQEEQVIWFAQVSSKKSIVKHLMRLISVESISSAKFKLSVVCLDLLVDMVVTWSDPQDEVKPVLLDQLVSVENFWTNIHKTAVSTDSSATTRCHCVRLMVNAFTLSAGSIPHRIFSDEIIASILDILSNHQSSSISRNRQNLRIGIDYLLLVFEKHPDRLQKHLVRSPHAFTPLIEICAQLIVSGPNLSAVKKLAESLVAESKNVYTPLALMIF